MDTKKFFGMPKKYIISGEEVELRPLKGKDLHLFDGVDSEGVEGVKRLVLAVLKEQVDPSLTKEDVDNFSIGSLNEFAEAIADINGFKKKA